MACGRTTFHRSNCPILLQSLAGGFWRNPLLYGGYSCDFENHEPSFEPQRRAIRSRPSLPCRRGVVRCDSFEAALVCNRRTGTVTARVAYTPYGKVGPNGSDPPGRRHRALHPGLRAAMVDISTSQVILGPATTTPTRRASLPPTPSPPPPRPGPSRRGRLPVEPAMLRLGTPGCGGPRQSHPRGGRSPSRPRQSVRHLRSSLSNRAVFRSRSSSQGRTGRWHWSPASSGMNARGLVGRNR